MRRLDRRDGDAGVEQAMQSDGPDIAQRRGHMLMVIPSNIEVVDGAIIVDGDFAHYVRLYLEAFETVVVACTASSRGAFPTREPLEAISDDEGRLRIIVLPMSYREDRYVLKRGSVRRLLAGEIAKADFVVVAPHSAFDWPTLAAEICLETGTPYNMEADWNLQQVNWSNWSKLPFGVEKLRRYLWMKYHDPKYLHAMRHSTVALLHGHDVYNAYKAIAPNPQVVNNVCVTEDDRIEADALAAKIARVLAGAPLEIVYAGRAIEMKGPFEWFRTLIALRERGVRYRATWYGEGELLDPMRGFVAEHGLGDVVTVAGKVERSTVFEALFTADIFLFCHLTRESPRNVIEALAAGAPLIGFGSPFYEHLVQDHGGGRFVDSGDVDGLAEIVAALDRDRPALAELIAQAARSGQQFDRTKAVRRRIALMQQTLLPAA
jgi:glycosyltransferase involved in cell wall biosynthesis